MIKGKIGENKMKRQGFTLIELLIVMLIIGILAGITTTVMVAAKKTVKASLVNAQFVQLSMALDGYKSKFGEYPPDFSDPVAVMRHVRKRWPRYGLSDNDYAKFCNHVYYGSKLSSNNAGCWDFSTFSETINTYPQYNAHYISALVFWLGGLPDANGSPSGFYLNPKAPFGYVSGAVPANDNYTTVASLPAAVQREDPLYDFKDGTVSTVNNIPALIINELPVLYFKATPNKTYVRGDNVINNMGPYGLPANQACSKYMDFSQNTDPKVQQLGIAVPYVRPASGATFTENGVVYKEVHWYEENRFQLLYPGADGRFSPVYGSNDAASLSNFADLAAWRTHRISNPPCPATGQNLYTEDKDNVVNFAGEGTTIESLSAN